MGAVVLHSKEMTTEQLIAQYKGMGGTVTTVRKGKRTVTEAQWRNKFEDADRGKDYFSR